MQGFSPAEPHSTGTSACFLQNQRQAHEMDRRAPASRGGGRRCRPRVSGTRRRIWGTSLHGGGRRRRPRVSGSRRGIWGTSLRGGGRRRRPRVSGKETDLGTSLRGGGRRCRPRETGTTTQTVCSSSNSLLFSKKGTQN